MEILSSVHVYDWQQGFCQTSEIVWFGCRNPDNTLPLLFIANFHFLSYTIVLQPYPAVGVSQMASEGTSMLINMFIIFEVQFKQEVC